MKLQYLLPAHLAYALQCPEALAGASQTLVCIKSSGGRIKPTECWTLFLGFCNGFGMDTVHLISVSGDFFSLLLFCANKV